MTERTNYEDRRTPRPKRKRPEESRPEPERTRTRRPQEEQPRSTRSERARPRAAQEDADRQRALHRRRKRRRLRRRVYRILLAVLAVVFVLSAAMVARGLLRHDALKGTWTLDESTAYVFDGKGGGMLRLPMGSYAFSYTIEDNLVTLDFADESLSDASYSFLLGRDALTLDTNTGTVYWLEREGRWPKLYAIQAKELWTLCVSSTVSFEGNAVVYNNRNNGQQANVVLDEDALAHKNGPETNNGVILTTANGLGTGAHIGVYVVGDDSTNPYADHGQSTQPFGTVQGSDTSKQNLGDDIVPGSRDGVVMSIG